MSDNRRERDLQPRHRHKKDKLSGQGEDLQHREVYDGESSKHSVVTSTVWRFWDLALEAKSKDDSNRILLRVCV